MKPDRRHAIVALLLVVALSLAGCTALQETDGSGYPSEEEVRTELSSLETVQADVLVETTVGGNETRMTMELARSFASDRYAATVTSGTTSGMQVVMNGSGLWYYSPASDTVRVLRDSSINQSVDRTVRTVSSIYAALDDGDDGEASGSVGISPAPTVPLTPTASSPTGGGIDLPMGENVTVQQTGTATIDGRETRVVELEVEDGIAAIQNATYWIDRELHFPLKATVAVRIGNETTVVTTTYRNVTFDEPIDPATFDFDPPATARVVDAPDGSLRSFRSRSALGDATNVSIPDPDLPAAYEFDLGQLTPTGGNTTLTLLYSSPERTITVTKYVGRSAPLSAGDPITVGGRDARLVAGELTPSVLWTCGGDTYSVGGADASTLRSVAASMACE